MTGDAVERFRRDYAPAFLQYLSEGTEPGRRRAYELGRRAISEHLSILDLARIHHSVLLDVLKTHRTPHELEHTAQAASEFLVEALAVFEMTQRGFTELLATPLSDQQQPSAEDRPDPDDSATPIRFGPARPWVGERRRPRQAGGPLPARAGC